VSADGPELEVAVVDPGQHHEDVKQAEQRTGA
jgi:hypothetical protein